MTGRGIDQLDIYVFLTRSSHIPRYVIPFSPMRNGVLAWGDWPKHLRNCYDIARKRVIKSFILREFDVTESYYTSPDSTAKVGPTNTQKAQYH